MTDTGYIVWMVGTAIATIVILAVGTLTAADLLPRPRRRPRRRPSSDARTRTGRDLDGEARC